MKFLNKKLNRFAATATLAVGLLLSFAPASPVKAEEKKTSGSTTKIYEISMADQNPIETLKAQIIKDRAGKDASVNMNNVDIANSVISTSENFNITQQGLQTLTVRVNLADKDSKSASVGYDFSENITVRMNKPKGPQILLTTQNITLDLGSPFDYTAYIGYLSGDNGILPALKETDNVDIYTEGTYTAEITAIDPQGDSTTVEMTITVRKPPEIIREEQIREEEYNAKWRVLEASVHQGSIGLIDFTGDFTPMACSANPYPLGWANCTYGAWQAAYQKLGIMLPNWGNAYEWVIRAQASGYETGTEARVNSIMVTTNHVLFVDEVSPDGSLVHVIEGNFNGHYNERWCSAYGNEQTLRGYVYLQ